MQGQGRSAEAPHRPHLRQKEALGLCPELAAPDRGLMTIDKKLANRD